MVLPGTGLSRPASRSFASPRLACQPRAPRRRSCGVCAENDGKGGGWLQDALKKYDSAYFKNKARDLNQDVKRNLPVWSRQTKAFFNTPLGNAAAILLFAFSISTGLLFKAINLFLLSWILLPLIAVPVLTYIGKQAAERQQAAEEAEEARRRQANFGFGSTLDDLLSSLGGKAAQGRAGQAQQRQAPSGASRAGRGGPSKIRPTGDTIDVEWTSVDDGKG